MNIKKKLETYLYENLETKEKSFGLYKSKRLYNMTEEYCTSESNINNYINENKDENTFQTKLFYYIDSKNLKDSDVYNKVSIDRRLFSKIRSNKDYHPSKETIILLAIAIELTEDELEDLLTSASYSLPMNTTYDLIIRFCFKEKIYNLNQINEFLYDHNCKVLN